MKKGYTQEQAEGFVEVLTETEIVTKSYMDMQLSGFEAKLYKALLIHGLAVVLAVLAAVEIL